MSTRRTSRGKYRKTAQACFPPTCLFRAWESGTTASQAMKVKWALVCAMPRQGECLRRSLLLSDQLGILHDSRRGRRAVCAHPERRRAPLARARCDACWGRNCTEPPTSHHPPCDHLQKSITVLSVLTRLTSALQ